MIFSSRNVVFGAALLFFPAMVSAATLEVSVGRTSVSAGDTIIAAVVVSSPDQAVNAISGQFSFSRDLLTVMSVSKENSIVKLWVQDPTYSNAAGTVEWSGVVPNPGWSGLRGQILFVQFRAKQAGDATISFTSSAVLANDGNGTNILTGAIPKTLTILATVQKPVVAPSASIFRPRITSTTHPDENMTYRAGHAELRWTNDPAATAVRIGVNNYRDAAGTVVYTPAISHREIDLEDGVWYFHVQDKVGGEWGPLSTYALRVDSQNGVELPVVVEAATSSSIQTVPAQTFSPQRMSLPLWLMFGMIGCLFGFVIGAIAGVWYMRRTHVGYTSDAEKLVQQLTKLLDKTKQ